MGESGGAIDRLLVPILTARSPEESRRLLGDLLESHLSPVIRGIIRHKMQLFAAAARNSQDAEDLYGDAVAKLLERLQALRDDCRPADTGADPDPTWRPPVGEIANVAGYAATVAYSACEDFLRRKYPERRRLKNRVQYLLTHRSEFGLWEMEEGEWYGGFEAWRNRRSPAGSGDRLRELGELQEEFERAELGGRNARHGGPAELVSAVFRWVGGPVELDALVNVLRELWQIREDDVRAEETEEALERRIAPSAHRQDVSDSIERRACLSRVWLEICELPARQRCAVLLNLRDGKGCSAVELFSLLGVATIRQIAAALEIPANEFAVLWNELPLDDVRIAARLDITRQQVINLRKSARERLGRRIGGL